jgi:NAD(P)-dependent dehydrogenase (short-subunit alcohol dehydrogenase family)
VANESKGAVRVETVDINRPEQVAALRDRLADEWIDLLFVNAGISNGADETVAGTSTEAFTTLMVTNALSPLRVIEMFADLVPEDGVIAAMSSGLGSVTNNTSAGREVYRARKASLNMMLRSFAVRRGGGRTVLAVSPGWVKTDMGGPDASLDVETSVRGMVDAIAARRGQPGAAFVDYQGNDVAW